jgi:hypothetical protein
MLAVPRTSRKTGIAVRTLVAGRSRRTYLKADFLGAVGLSLGLRIIASEPRIHTPRWIMGCMNFNHAQLAQAAWKGSPKTQNEFPPQIESLLLLSRRITLLTDSLEKEI